MMILGAHEATAGGVDKALDRALAHKADAVQIFTSSPRQWKARAIPKELAATFRKRAKDLGLIVLSHASYLLNPATPENKGQRRTQKGLMEEISRCGLLGIPYLVIHPGSHLGAGTQKGLENVAKTIESVLDHACQHRVTILLENTAGTGHCLGDRLNHLGKIRSLLGHPKNLACLFDTCHGFAAGYSLHPGPGLRRTLDDMESSIGTENILGFHINDSLHPRGAKRDRHAIIGEGRIGLSAMASFVAIEVFTDRPAILETPPLKDGTPSFALGLKRLRSTLKKRGLLKRRKKH